MSGAHEPLAALSQYFVRDATMAQTLGRVCEAARGAVPAAKMIGISTSLDGELGTYACTDPQVEVVDRAQYRSKRGPCVDAFANGHTVSLPSTSDPNTPYPEFSSAAAAHGIGSVLSLPMITDDVVVGALNLYAGADHAFGEESSETALRFAVQAGFLLANAQAYWDARTLSENLTEAMASRAVIEQAKGIIMAARSCTPDDAFGILVAQSQHENIKVRDLAAELVARHTHPPEGP